LLNPNSAKMSSLAPSVPSSVNETAGTIVTAATHRKNFSRPNSASICWPNRKKNTMPSNGQIAGSVAIGQVTIRHTSKSRTAKGMNGRFSHRLRLSPHTNIEAIDSTQRMSVVVTS
jgi:hypothetical protein